MRRRRRESACESRAESWTWRESLFRSRLFCVCACAVCVQFVYIDFVNYQDHLTRVRQNPGPWAQQAPGEGGVTLRGAESRRAVMASGRLWRLDPDLRRRVMDHVRGRHERVEGQVVGAALRLVPVLLAREEPQPPPGGSRRSSVSRHSGISAFGQGPERRRSLVSSAEQRELSL